MCIREKLQIYQFLLKASVQKSMQIFFGKIFPYFLLKALKCLNPMTGIRPNMDLVCLGKIRQYTLVILNAAGVSQ